MAKSDLDTILTTLRNEMPRLRREYGVTELALFGSQVRGEATDDSDVDILVTFGDKPIGLFEFVRLERELSERLDTQVDLVERKGLKPGIGERVLDETQPTNSTAALDELTEQAQEHDLGY